MPSASDSLQENVLTMLCFDSENISTLVSNVDVDMFDNDTYRDIADKAIKYYREYKRPISEHLSDVFEKKLNHKNKKERDLYKTVITGIYELHETVNAHFVMRELRKFIREQNTRLTLKEAFEKYQEGDLDAVDRVLSKKRKRDVDIFDPGIRFGRDMRRTLSFLNKDEELFHTGIKHLDERGICPARKELFCFVGLPSTGKSWGITHIGKMGLLTRSNVAHVTLEMSEDKCSMRYVQTLLAVSKNSKEVKQIELKIDEHGKVLDMKLEELTNISTFKDRNIEVKLAEKIKKIRRPHLVIKQFPTGMLTIEMLQTYLDNLRTYADFIPDILLIDYADLMSLDSKYLRVETGQIYQKLRGIAIENNIAVVTASQANRVGENVLTLTRKHLAEDFSKVAIADNVITYNQTPAEYKLGLARLYVDKARNDRKGDSILIVQDYAIGQYCLQSAMLKGNYFEQLEGKFHDVVNDSETFTPRVKTWKEKNEVKSEAKSEQPKREFKKLKWTKVERKEEK